MNTTSPVLYHKPYSRLFILALVLVKLALIEFLSNPLSPSSAIFGISLVAFAYALSLVIFRIFLSPLAKFPGSRLAAATGWFEFHHDVLRLGMYIYEIERMHDLYGPIIRVNPWELSIRDPEFYDELYVLGNVRRSDKYNKFCQGSGLDGTFLKSHLLMNKTQRIQTRLFSRMDMIFIGNVVGFEKRIVADVGKVVRFDHALTCLSGDIIRSVTCGDQQDLLMNDPNWSKSWFDLFVMVVKSAPLMTSLPFLIHIALMFPTSWLLWFFPNGKAYQGFKNIARTHIIQAKEEALNDELNHEKRSFNTLFHPIANMSIPESEKDTERLVKEAQSLFGAAAVAVGRTLECISFYLLENKDFQSRLASELGTLEVDWQVDVPRLSELEKLPFLQAIINEGLRFVTGLFTPTLSILMDNSISYGSMHRMPRLSPDQPIQYKQWTIPVNVPVGMSAYFNHTDPSIYPNPKAFIPDRWLGAIDPRMKKALTPFTRGSRMCLGNHLAIAEINTAIAVLFRPGGVASSMRMRLHETDESDVACVHDYMIPMPKWDSRGLRVKVLA